MKTILPLTLAILCGSAPSYGQVAPPPPSAPQTTAAPAPPSTAADEASRGADLKDLDAMTFACPRAGLNAAAREAAKERSLGTYQFSFFRIVNESHHAAYEVHFTSNYTGEPELKYCVMVYCQQGWDPRTTKATVTRMIDAPRAKKPAAHQSMCGVVTPPPAPRKTVR